MDQPEGMTEEEMTALCADVVALMSSRGATIQNGIEALSRLMASTALAATETRFAAADMVEEWMKLLATSLRDQSIAITEHKESVNTTLCEQCFPAWDEHLILTIVPLGPCCQCGKYDERHIGGVLCHLFRDDPRLAEHSVAEVAH